MNVELPDGTIIEDVPEGTTKEQLLGKLQLAKHPAAQSLMQKMATDQTLGEMSEGGKSLAGWGLSVANIKRAGQQMLGMDSDYQENRGQDRALSRTASGAAGNIAGSITNFAPLAVIPGANTVAGAGVIGSIMAGFNPTDTTGERFGNMAQGGAMGAGLQAVAQYPNQIYEGVKSLVKKPFETAHAAVEPLYEGGRKNILARTLAGATGPGRAQAITDLKGAKELVPGSLPTAAESTQSGGLAALQRSAAAADPESYATRSVQQNEARARALQDLAGTSGRRTAAERARDAAAGPLYKQARQQGVDPEMAKVLQPQIKNLMERVPSGVKEKARELARLNGEVMDKGGSVNGLHWMKLAVDDMLSSGGQTGIGSQTKRALTQYKDDLLTVIDDLSPAYGQARQTYHQLSKPVNQMDTAQLIADKSINKLTGQVQPQNYARALSDDSAVAATGFNKATLKDTFDPPQLGQLEAIKQDLARSVMARDLGRGPGSDTTQKLAMTNLMQRSGLPMGVLHTPGIGRVGNWLYQNADDEMRQVLAKTLLDPKKTAGMMEGFKPYVPMGAPSQLTRDRAGLLARGLLLPSAIPSSE